jgi:hypothetical protein
VENPISSGNTPPANTPQVGSPVNPVVPTDQAPAAQMGVPQKQTATQGPPPTQVQSPASAVSSEPRKSKFKLFLIISVVLIVVIWGAVAYIYFQNQSL